jgi:cyanoexosortase A
MITASLVVFASISRAWLTQTIDVTVMVALVWGAALCCVEDRLATLRPRPNRIGFALGIVLLVLAQWRQERLIEPQRIILLLPLLQGIGLMLLASPPRQWGLWRDSLLALALAPFAGILKELISVTALSRITSYLSQALLLSLGLEAEVAGTLLILPGGVVSVADRCSGLEMFTQLVVVGGLFSLVFPLGRGWRRWLSMLIVMGIAPLFALLVNALRVSLLAVIHASKWQQKEWWFNFFHAGSGEQLFSLLAVMAFAPAYFRIQDHLLAQKKS